jgi:hypothetical protein
MVSLAQGNLIVFYGLAVLTFFWSFIRGKEWTQISTKGLNKSAWKTAAAILLPALVLYGAAQIAGMQIGMAGLYFAPAFLLAFILERLNIAPWQRALLLLMLSVGACLAMPVDQSNSGLVAMIAGLLLAKLTNNLLEADQCVLEDVIPSIVWLCIVAWTHQSGSTADAGMQQGLVLATLSTTILLRWVQKPLLHKHDPVYLKRIMLSLVGGLLMLCLITKVVAALTYPKIAFVAGVGFLFAYLLETGDRAKDEPTLKAFKQLVLIGILTIAASRIFGMLGLLILAAAMPVVTARSTAMVASAFWCARVIAQIFIVQYNPNVTGVNLTHSYCTAAMYAGFVLICIFSLFMRDIANKWLYLILALALAVALPASSNYFIHAEPTGSLLISAGVASILIVIFAPSFYQRTMESQDTIILLPALMGTVAIMSNELLAVGEASTNHDRLVVVGVIAGIILCVGIASNFVSRPKGKAAVTTTEPTAQIDAASS